MKKQVVVIGLGRFGESLARSLSSFGHDVLALDTSEERVKNASTQVTHAVQADATNETALNELGVRNYDVAIVAIGSDLQTSALATILLKKLGIPYLIARANNVFHGEILSKIGADKVVLPEREMGYEVANEVRLGGVSGYMSVAPGYGIARMEVPADSVGKTLSELGFERWGKEGVSTLLIHRGKRITVTPRLDEAIESGDILVVAGSDDRLEAFCAKMAASRESK